MGSTDIKLNQAVTHRLNGISSANEALQRIFFMDISLDGNCLVVWNMNLMTFHSVGNNHPN